MATQSRPGQIASRPSAPVRRAPASGTRAPANVGPRSMGRPVRQPVAMDYGYTGLGGPAPVIVQAKPSWARPGSVTAACVMGFIVAGFCVIASMAWLTWADFEDEFGGDSNKPMAFGLVNLGIAILLILGGIGSITRQQWGRVMAMAGAGAHVAYALFRVVDSRIGMFNIIFVVTGIIIIALLAMPPASRYFSTRSPLGYE